MFTYSWRIARWGSTLCSGHYTDGRTRVGTRRTSVFACYACIVSQFLIFYSVFLVDIKHIGCEVYGIPWRWKRVREAQRGGCRDCLVI